MASIERRNDGWRVRWRDPDETPRSRQCPSAATAKTLAREVEDASALGRRWEPRDAREQADLRVLFKDYIEECVRVLKPATASRYALALDLFLRFCDDTFGKGKPLPPSILTRRLLADRYTALKHNGLHGRERGDQTRRKMVEVLQLAWQWLFDNDESNTDLPMPRKLRMVRGPASPTIAPTWAEMDSCIAALDGWHRDLAVVLRFTGLRAQQAMSITWDDLDLSNARLRIRGELGKSKQEQRGRIVPVSPHLVRRLTASSHEDRFVVPCNRQPGPRQRLARARDTERGWTRAEVRPEACAAPTPIPTRSRCARRSRRSRSSSSPASRASTASIRAPKGPSCPDRAGDTRQHRARRFHQKAGWGRWESNPQEVALGGF